MRPKDKKWRVMAAFIVRHWRVQASGRGYCVKYVYHHKEHIVMDGFYSEPTARDFIAFCRRYCELKAEEHENK